MIHGDIRVHFQLIGEWTAERKEQVAVDVHMYDCKVTYRNLAGYPLAANFRVKHRHTNGAVALAALVLSESGYHLKPERMIDE